MFLSLFAVSACIYDDRSECVLNIRFTYTYNVKDADAFSAEVKEIELYIFDEDGIFIRRLEDRSEGFPATFSIFTNSLTPGDYTFVALGRNRSVEDPSREFGFSDIIPGESVLSDFFMKLNTDAGVCNSEIAALYNGVMQVTLKPGPQSVTVPMMKLTNRFRIILMPYAGSGSLDAEDFDICIEGNAGWLDYKGDKYADHPVEYRPYMQQSFLSGEVASPEVAGAAVADINSSRILYDDRPMLVIRMSGDGRELLRLNLAWFLSLQGIDEHRQEWSNQEYLDRQDAYSIKLFVDQGLFIKSLIIVNGWEITLNDVSLG